ncbi:hypothetical protein BJ508DRAFT_351405 [Ascobolus immersus RN42]|uniref:Uncharacterized protein n=1 Tax=Ascobolus immersus RN42 TaxID=1160509 RepID=A0A3N4HXE9_ASCIM|nr:hypothetical protein BJ508DRAFT_351405 [Ascobolus immersus RN42]
MVVKESGLPDSLSPHMRSLLLRKEAGNVLQICWIAEEEGGRLSEPDLVVSAWNAVRDRLSCGVIPVSCRAQMPQRKWLMSKRCYSIYGRGNMTFPPRPNQDDVGNAGGVRAPVAWSGDVHLRQAFSTPYLSSCR